MLMALPPGCPLQADARSITTNRDGAVSRLAFLPFRAPEGPRLACHEHPLAP